VKQTFAHVGDLLKKPTIRDKTKPLGFYKVGLESGQPRVTRLEHLILPSGTRKCQFHHALLHLEE
jgi:hypothetical protein